MSDNISVYTTTCPDCDLVYRIGNGHLTTDCIARLKAQIAEKVERIEQLRNPSTNPDDYPCPHAPDSGCPSCAPDDTEASQ